MKTIAIIDGDIVAYRCSAANETRSVRATHKTTTQVITTPHRTALKAQIKDKFELEEFRIEDVQTAEDISHALHAMKTTIEALCRTCKTTEYEIYLGGENNFRDFLPLPTKYKGKRDDLLRPIQLKECKDYLFKRHKAIYINGREADDMLAQRAWEGTKTGDKIIQVTIDKDASGCFGWLYNWNKMKEPMFVEGLGDIELGDDNKVLGFGRKWFYTQWVLGDPTDNYKPCELAEKKFGDVSAFKLLKDCSTDKECIEAIYKQYKKWHPDPVSYEAWDGSFHTKDVIEIMDMYAACAHMKRFESDVFDTRKLLGKLGIEHGEKVS